MTPLPTPYEQNAELVLALCRFAEGLIDEEYVRERFVLDEADWSALAENKAVRAAIKELKLQRRASGDTRRERSQMLALEVPDTMGNILRDPAAPARAKIEAGKTLVAMADGRGAEDAAAKDRFIITINLGDGNTETYDLALAPAKPLTLDNAPLPGVEDTPRKLLGDGGADHI